MVQQRSYSLPALSCFLGLFILAVTYEKNSGIIQISSFSNTILDNEIPVQQASLSSRNAREEEEEQKLVGSDRSLAELSEKLKPKSFDMVDESTLSPHQFLHLHHMKTGGTSMDQVLRCAMNRMKKDKSAVVPYTSIHECSDHRYRSCKSGADARCKQKIDEAAILSYCAPLYDLPVFNWKEPVQAITVLRNPVERVWSMYRFQTKKCYKCNSLLEVYKAIDEGHASEYPALCQQQIQNHEVANLLSTEWPKGADDDDLVAEAVQNMKEFFTIIGLTEQLNTTVNMVGEVFPFMKESVEWSDQKCPLPHANKSPSNNRCGAGFTHMDLPPHPDEETRLAIEAHNRMDMKLYKAALQHFELQKQALGIEEEST